MAKFATSGMNDMAKQLMDAGEGTGELAKKMVLAGADKMVSQWKWEIKSAGHIESGDMINSVRRDKNARKEGEAVFVEIYAAGRLNGEKAFLTHYGTSKKQGSHWVDKAEQNAQNKCMQAMTEIYDEEMRKRGL